MRMSRLVLAWLLLAGLPLAVHAAVPSAVPSMPSPASPANVAGTPGSWATQTAAQKRELRSRYAAWQALPESDGGGCRTAGCRPAGVARALPGH